MGVTLTGLTLGVTLVGLTLTGLTLGATENPPALMCGLGDIAEDVGFEPTRVVKPARVPGV